MPNRTIIITGASDGIGAAAARRLKANGENVVVVGRSATEDEGRGGSDRGGTNFVADFARFGRRAQAASDLKATYTHIDVLMNNAGGIFGDRNRTVDGLRRPCRSTTSRRTC